MKEAVLSGEKETNRIEAFSDGVFAIAITLLILDVKVPDVHQHANTSLWQELLNQWPVYVALATSFFSILIMWVNHHALFNLISKIDNRFMFANGLLLLLVIIVPFPTALLSEYYLTDEADVACAVYAGSFALICVSYNLLWWSANYKGKLLKESVTDSFRKEVSMKFFLGIPSYLIAVVAAFINVHVCMAICSSLWIFWAFSMRNGKINEQNRNIKLT